MQTTAIDKKDETQAVLAAYEGELLAELQSILEFWMRHTPDAVHGGFVGRIDEEGRVHPGAPKGSVLHSRILWAFSSAYLLTKAPEHLQTAKRALDYICEKFIDPQYGGVYWSIAADGTPLDTKKQIYALAFAIYGCAAYVKACGDEAALKTAIGLYEAIEAHSFDPNHTGYIDAFSRDWKELQDIRLSAKDANEKKTMNTHLHILEAYTALYRVWPDAGLKDRILLLLKNFTEHIIDPKSGHLVLFFDEQWNRKGNIVSYGHDIEAAWLLAEAVEAIGEPLLVEQVNEISLRIAAAAAEGLDVDAGLWYEWDKDAQHLVKEKHWWVQAEAMVGFFHAWQKSHDDKWLGHSLAAWRYTKSSLIDYEKGEWWWGRTADGALMQGQDKAGTWKCPYHNSRACLEIISRIRDS